MATRDAFRPTFSMDTFRDRWRSNIQTTKCGFYSRSALYPWVNSDSSVGLVSYGEYQRTLDYSAPFYWLQEKMNADRSRIGMAILDIGNPFWTEKVYLTLPSFRMPSIRMGGDASYRIPVGPLYPNSTDPWAAQLAFKREAPLYANAFGVPFDDMVVYGAAGIKMAMPSVPAISMFQILGEIREGLPRIPGSTLFDWPLVLKNLRTDPKRVRYLFAKGAPWKKSGVPKLNASGSEYLNVVFGIMPTAQSIVDLIDIARNYPALMQTFHDDRYGRTRRHRQVRNFTEENTTSSMGYPFPMVDSYQPKGLYVTTVTKQTRVWVDTAWSPRPAVTALDSWLRSLPDWVGTLGALPNAANLWELVPFSWLVDYFTNAGTILSNLSYGGVNGMGLDYAYAMAEMTERTQWSWTGSYRGYPIHTTMSRVAVTRQRVRATPFGFGLRPEDLTPSQLAILAALGISRRSLSK